MCQRRPATVGSRKRPSHALRSPNGRHRASRNPLSAVLLETQALGRTFTARTFTGRVRQRIHAVQDVSLKLNAGQTLAVVGESGAGKSTFGRLVLRLIEPDAGSVTFDGIDLRSLNRKQLRTIRRRMQMIFQNPYS